MNNTQGKAQNRNMERKRRQGSKTPQNTNNNILKDLEETRDESPVFDIRRISVRMFNEPKEELKQDIKNQLNELQTNMNKMLEKTQKQLNELKEDLIKFRNEIKGIIEKGDK
jgi:DNA anti-recombination protein RmuC